MCIVAMGAANGLVYWREISNLAKNFIAIILDGSVIILYSIKSWSVKPSSKIFVRSILVLKSDSADSGKSIPSCDKTEVAILADSGWDV